MKLMIMKPFPIIRKFVDSYKSQLLSHYYSLDNMSPEGLFEGIVYMADGKMLHGGLSDRLCGLISVYNYAKQNDLRFKINFVSPYLLSDILLPAEYDWIIGNEEISYNSEDSHPIYLSVYSTDTSKVIKHTNRVLNKIRKKQIHIYTNMRYFSKSEFSSLFHELFRPTEALQRMIENYSSEIPESYVSITFRFQQLLGDFKEGNFKKLKDENKKEKLIEKCKNCVIRIREKEKTNILVTSDSSSFLDIVSSLDNVYVIPGKIRHMDFSKEENVDISIDMKSYVDLFLLSKAKKIFLCNIKPLYHSTFAQTASFINNRPYIELSESDFGL